MSAHDRYPHTPDGRYFVVKGRLWRMSNPALDAAERQRLVNELMTARRAVRGAHGKPEAMRAARMRVQAAKVALGERGPAWWNDGTPDYSRHMVMNTPYAEWFSKLSEPEAQNSEVRETDQGALALPARPTPKSIQ